jgi:hypothetical protein
VTVRAHLGWKAIPLWLDEHAMELGVPVSIAFVTLFLAGLVLLFGYPGPPENVGGTVVAFGFREDEGRGSVPIATVQVEGRKVHVEAPVRYGCRIGDHIQLQRRRVRWGATYGMALVPWPCGKG